jgi:hypothetical protein
MWRKKKEENKRLLQQLQVRSALAFVRLAA